MNSRRWISRTSCVLVVLALGACGAAVGQSVPEDTLSVAQDRPARAASDELVAEVIEAFFALRPTIPAQAGFNLLNNRLIEDSIEPCMVEKGTPLVRSELSVDKDAIAVFGAGKNVNGVDARWPAPPDREGARNGLGLAGPANIDYQVEDEAVTLGLDDVELERYGRNYDACLVETAVPLPFDRAAYAELVAQYYDVGSAAFSSPGFAVISVAYSDCMAGRGYEVKAPEEILDIVKGIYAEKGVVDGANYERAIAVSDAECRAPLFTEFILLNADGWRKWLDGAAPEIDKIGLEFARLSAEATR